MRLQAAQCSVAERASELGVLLVHYRKPGSAQQPTSYVHTAVTRPVVSQLHAPPIVSGGHVHTSRGHVPTFRMYIPTSGAYVPTYEVPHGTSHAMNYGPYYGTQYGQGSSPVGINNLLTPQIMDL